MHKRIKIISPDDEHKERIQPGRSTQKQQEMLENGEINPFTKQPYSQKYKTILKQRQSLPVHKQRAEFLDLVHSNQVFYYFFMNFLEL